MALPHGAQRAIAKRAGISEQLLCDIIAGRRQCRSDLAKKLVDAAAAEGIVSCVFDWLYPEASMLLEGKL